VFESQTLRKDAQRKHKEEVAEQVKKEKREARFERSRARKRRLQEAATSTMADKKKLAKDNGKKPKSKYR
jgi:hypothetical protein